MTLVWYLHTVESKLLPTAACGADSHIYRSLQAVSRAVNHGILITYASNVLTGVLR